ncbi:MAG: hypothetical protein ACF8LL_09870, partial [Phycisphaerales bacterium]
GMSVQKTGRSTDLTESTILDIDFCWETRYRIPGGETGRIGFKNLVLCRTFTAAGDSGSAVLTKNRRVLGLHMAGSLAGSVFCRIGKVFDALGIELA